MRRRFRVEPARSLPAEAGDERGAEIEPGEMAGAGDAVEEGGEPVFQRLQQRSVGEIGDVAVRAVQPAQQRGAGLKLADVIRPRKKRESGLADAVDHGGAKAFRRGGFVLALVEDERAKAGDAPGGDGLGLGVPNDFLDGLDMGGEFGVDVGAR